MKHSAADLLNVVYSYYPRRMLSGELDYKESHEHRQLVAARRKAGAEDRHWRTLLQHIGEQFPGDSVINNSLGLATGGMDAAYYGKVFPAGAGDDLSIEFLVSFLVPYYVIYSSRIVEDLEKKGAPRARVQLFFEGDTCHVLPSGPDTPTDVSPTPTRRIVRFDFSPEERPYADYIARGIEAAWRHERMPPEVGKLIVPDVSTNLRYLGEATLYDCLFADDWLK